MDIAIKDDEDFQNVCHIDRLRKTIFIAEDRENI